jgi:hypothetical protein
MLPTKFRSIWPSGFRGEDFFLKLANQKQELPMAAMFVIGSGQNEQSLERTFHVSLHSAEGFQRTRLKCEKLMDDRCWTPSDGKSSHCLRQSELKINEISWYVLLL